ncbi:MAG: condensation domain-containing protein, partial [Bacteroidota bacterium]
QGQTIQLPPKTSSYKQWSEQLEEFGRKESAYRGADYWEAIADGDCSDLPVDFPGGVNDEASTQSLSVSLDEEETEALLHKIHAAYRTEINDVLLAALCATFSRWMGIKRLLIDLEGHGREDLIEGVDVSRTVGWFTAIYPVLLDTGGGLNPGDLLREVKEQMRRVPDKGIGYMASRYLNPETSMGRRLQSLPRPQVCFNYLGQMGTVQQERASFVFAPELRGPERSPQALRTHLIEVDGGVSIGCLRLEWNYSENLFRKSTIESLGQIYLESLRAIIAHCLTVEGEGYTVSDFADFGWNETDLNAITSEISKSSR